MSMIERVAKAIYEDRNGAGCKPWSHRPIAHRRPYLDDARAALKAMREPTEAMRTAGINVEPLHSDPRDIYRAMIDVALSEGHE